MTAVPKAKLTVAEYLALERRAEVKSEFYDGEMFARAGASRGHNIVNENLSGGPTGPRSTATTSNCRRCRSTC